MDGLEFIGRVPPYCPVELMLIGSKDFYHIVTQPFYLLLLPWFTDLRMSVGWKKNIEDHRDGAQGWIVRKSVKINGVQWDKSWITHEDLVGIEGGRIDFVLGSKQTEWDSEELPPSPGHLDLGLQN